LGNFWLGVWIAPHKLYTTAMLACYDAAQRLLLYRHLWQTPVGQAWLTLLRSLVQGDPESQCFAVYSQWLVSLAVAEGVQGSWSAWLWQAVAQDDNPFARAASHGEIPPGLAEMAAHDLALLHGCAQSWPELEAALRQAGLPTFSQPEGETPAWAATVQSLAHYYRCRGVGFWGRYRVARWRHGQMVGIPHPDPVCLEDLCGWERQKNLLLQNTQALVQGSPALHVLLYGARGTGKSSLVKAVAQVFYAQGLRLLEVSRDDLLALPEILLLLAREPHPFILFVDDLSFGEEDSLFRPLKGLLEGDAAGSPAHVRVYATSNRRHLIRESFGDRPDPEEIHPWDTVQEKLALADRFGLTLTFSPLSQADYLATVTHLAARQGICREDLLPLALQWAQQHNGFSGRTAQQVITAIQAGLIPTKS